MDFFFFNFLFKSILSAFLMNFGNFGEFVKMFGNEQ